MKLSQIAAAIGAEIFDPQSKGDYDHIDIRRVRPIQEAATGDITFLANPDYTKFLAATGASAVILAARSDATSAIQLVHHNPYFAFAKVAQLFYQPELDEPGISPQAVVASTAKIAANVTIYPFVYVSPDAVVEEDVILYPGVFVGRRSRIGRSSVIHPNCYIGHDIDIGERCLLHAGTVLGADGFGFATDGDKVVKIPQIGRVIVEDDVEMGGVCTVDRAAMGETRIGRHTKFDSKVHIGHNVEVGERCMFSALTGIAGSTKIGKNVLFGGHSGASGHLHVQDGVRVGAMTGVIQETKAGETYLGFPGTPASEWKRRQVYFKKLPTYEKRIKNLERLVEELMKK